MKQGMPPKDDDTNVTSKDVLVKYMGIHSVGYFSYRMMSWYLYSRHENRIGVDEVDEWWPLPEAGTGIVPTPDTPF